MTDSDDPRVFEVMKVEQVALNRWNVYGLSYKTIEVGDTLYCDQTPQLSVKVLAISVFDREIEEVSSGYYANISLSGEGGQNLTSSSHLVTVTKNDSEK